MTEQKIAVVNGKHLPISNRQSIEICKFLKGKKIDEALKLLSEVVKGKRAIPMRGELPHRKGMMSGRYPKNAAMQFIKLIKSLSANALRKNLDVTQLKIYGSANTAPRPVRGGRFRKKFKRTHITLIAK
ncbi:50S ribosomal protein L22 [Candidatus Pacearchaeota archaeon]|nr:50S ribosomal protein L22 [Candidatus Pacearchaeota archaeon]